jgi:hypothetical protein
MTEVRKLEPYEFRCEMCGQIFNKGWTDEDAREESKLLGIPDEEPCGLVCDDCFSLTPWGRGDLEEAAKYYASRPRGEK